MNTKKRFNIIAVTLILAGFAVCGKAFAASPEANLKSLGITLPTSNAPVANYVSVVRTGNLLFLAGHLPKDSGGAVVTGKLGADMTLDAGYEASRLAGIALIGTLKSELGDLERVSRIVKVNGMVNATDDFTQHSQVINGCSDLLVDVFGNRGRHARAACGYSSLPLGAAVEIELIVEID